MREHLPRIVFQLHAAVGEAVSFPYSRTEHGKQKNRRVVILRTKQDLECRWQPWPAVMVISDEVAFGVGELGGRKRARDVAGGPSQARAGSA